jgi:hypothetical protein
MRKILAFFLLLFVSINIIAQNSDQKLIIITTDGFRWQEVYKGMDQQIASNGKFNQGDSVGIFKKYWSSNSEERRKKLLPFFWNTIASQGQLYGNREYGNYVDNANPYWFSYPGYSEIMTGIVDTLINTNDYPPNPHTTILDFYNRQPAYKNKVAAFGAWEAFDRILNEKRAGFPVLSSFDDNSTVLKNSNMELIRDMLKNSFRPFGNAECLDVFTHYQALTYIKAKKPSVLYISYGETDEWAHHGDYKFYLDAAHQFDAWVKEIWEYVQSQPEYKNKTTLLITTDHGRGDLKKDEWTDHGQGVSDAHEIWFALMGPKVSGLGEIKTKQQHYQQQLAQTAAILTGMKFTAEHKVADGIMIK